MNVFLSYGIYIFFGVMPSLIWLNFYLKRDAKPEPKIMILKIFFYGMLATLPAFFLETFLFKQFGKLNFSAFIISLVNMFLAVALVEEVLKFLVVQLKVLNKPEFDEPVDAMIYMIIAALGFAAGENILVLVSAGNQGLFGSGSRLIEISLLRFLGATFLHALSSGIVGFFLGLSFRDRKKRLKLVLFGLAIAVLLHGFYNFSIIKAGGDFKILIPFFLLLTSAVFVSWSFKKLKK